MDWLINILIEILCPALGLIILAGLLVYWILKKKLLRENSLKLIAYIFSGAIIFQSIFSTILNWWMWSKEKVTQRLLPPFTPLTYVLHYSWQHYLFEPVITIITALLIFWLIKLLNRRFGNNFFYDEEPYLASLGILITGWPYCLLFLCLVLFLGVVSHLFYIFFSAFVQKRARDMFFRNHPEPRGQGVRQLADERGEDLRERARWASERVEENISRAPFRLSLLYFWLPSALLVLFLGGIISKYIGITQFVI